MRRLLMHLCTTCAALAVLVAPVHAKPQAKKRTPAATRTVKSAASTQLIGKWNQVGGEDQIEFTSDGVFKAGNSQMSLSGKYVVRSDGDLEIDLGLSRITKGNIIRKIDLHGDKLTLTDPNNKLAVAYQRAK